MIKEAFERLLFACRFLLAPLYLALAVSLVALMYKSGLHLYQMLIQLPAMSDEDVLLSDLAIVDMTLTASLVVIVFMSGYANFVAPVVGARKRRKATLDLADRLQRAEAQADGLDRRHFGDQAARGLHGYRATIATASSIGWWEFT